MTMICTPNGIHLVRKWYQKQLISKKKGKKKFMFEYSKSKELHCPTTREFHWRKVPIKCENTKRPSNKPFL